MLVVGDLMLDRYMWGHVERISPEAPVPVVRLTETTVAAGGAANVAANIAGLGVRPILVGIVGDDNDGRELCEILATRGVQPENVIALSGRPTTVKSRIVAHGQHVVRVDQEVSEPVLPTQETEIIAKFSPLIEKANAVVISDYAKGFLTDNVIHSLIETARFAGKPVLVDPKGKDYSKYRGATILTPNKREAAEACSLDLNTPDMVDIAGDRLLRELECMSILITRGEEGMSLFQAGKAATQFPTMALEVFDVTGAGDTVIATLSAFIAAGCELESAAWYANIAAGLVVDQVGTTCVEISELEQAILRAEPRRSSAGSTAE